jgi:putative membrane protein
VAARRAGSASTGELRYLAVLGAIFAVEWTALAIEPRNRADWALENGLVVLAVAFLALSYRRLRLSRRAYTLIFVFLCLHEIGAHYTYSEVPYDCARPPGGRSAS